MRITESEAEQIEPGYVPVKVAELIDQRGYAPPPQPTTDSPLRAIGSPLATAAAILLVGLMLSSQYSRQADESDKRAISATGKATTLEQKSSLRDGSLQLRLRQYDALKREGVPIALLMDDLAKSVSPGVGLTAVTVKPNLELIIKGDASTESAMLKSLENMRPSQLLRSLTVTWFRRSKADPKRIEFEFRGATVSMADIQIRPQVKL